jgi:hypothetical protein
VISPYRINELEMVEQAGVGPASNEPQASGCALRRAEVQNNRATRGGYGPDFPQMEPTDQMLQIEDFQTAA